MKDAVRKAVAAVTGFILALVLLTALLITGFYLLIQAAILSLSPYLGQAGAMAVVGSGCALLLAVFFWRMTTRRSSAKSSIGKTAGTTSGIDKLRELIRENPLESALAAFAVGLAHESDPRLRTLLMQGGMELMKQTDSPPEPAPEHKTHEDHNGVET
ncbi:hypothetical protein DET50_10754 [Marinobacter pelagius]|uniref:Uncharacterized protein n=2 Tax=Marinobacter pelagius TaxID=379482 RepID=A0A366GST8_9GAMM|nr:hypothetical protein DET50_10754 [Marinobacter pelagius]